MSDTVESTSDSPAVASTSGPIADPSSSADLQIDQANALFNQGKRDYIVGETAKSVEELQEACQILSEKYGQSGDEMAEPYLYYGKALLELARMESDVLGNALDGVPEDEEVDDDEEEQTTSGVIVENGESLTEEEKEKISDDVIDAMTADRTEAKSETNGNKAESDELTKDNQNDVERKMETEKKGKTDEPKVETEAEKKEEDTGATEKVTSEEPAQEGEEDNDDEEAGDDDEGDDGEEEGGDNNEEAGEAEEEDVSNLQLAWEVLDLARVIFTRTDRLCLRAAEAQLALAEVAMEKEDFACAVEELRTCLTLQEKGGLTSTDRRLAETRYQLGIALLHVRDVEAGCEELNQAADGLRKKAEVSEGDEKKDLDELVKMIEGRVADAKEDQMDEEKLKKCLRDALVGATVTGFENGESSSAPADDISHLVRKKRKPETEVVEEKEKTSNGDGSPSCKMAKIENGNGVAEAVTAEVAKEPANGDSKEEPTNNSEKLEVESVEKTEEKPANGNGHVAEKMEVEEIKVKTVEDVQKLKESADNVA